MFVVIFVIIYIDIALQIYYLYILATIFLIFHVRHITSKQHLQKVHLRLEQSTCIDIHLTVTYGQYLCSED